MSLNRIITAAHCIIPKGEIPRKHEKDIVIILGAHDVIDPYETGRTTASAKEIIIQKDYNMKDHDKFTGDLAMVILTRNIELTEFIQPICLMINNHLNSYEGDAIVAGWGVTKSGETMAADTASLINVPIISNEKCYQEEPKLAQIGWNESFCAGKEGIGVCTGDSGSGLYVEVEGRYYLKGIVSAAVNGGGCEGSHFAIYTDVTKYDLSVEGRLKNLNAPEENFQEINQPKVIKCGRIPGIFPKKVYQSKNLAQDEFPWFVEMKIESVNFLGVFITPEKIVSLHNLEVSEFPLKIRVGKNHLDKNITSVQIITTNDGDAIAFIITLSSPVLELVDLPCLLPNFYTPDINEEIYSFDEKTSSEKRRQLSIGKNINLSECSDNSSDQETDRYCMQLRSSSDTSPKFAFTIKHGKLSLIGVLKSTNSLEEEIFDLITLQAISSLSVPVEYPGDGKFSLNN